MPRLDRVERSEGVEPVPVGWVADPSVAPVLDPDRPAHLARVAGRLPVVAAALGGLAAALGAVVLLGYVVRSDRIVELAPALPPMYPNAAVGFVAGGLAVVAATRGSRRAGLATMVGGTVMGAVGAVSLVLHLIDAGPTWVEGLWPANAFVVPTTAVPGRPAVETCTAFVLVGTALVLLGLRRAPRTAQALALGATTVGFAAAVGYAVGVDRSHLGGTLAGIGMALHTAVGIMLLGVGTILARPHVGVVAQLTDAGPAGRIGRRLVLLVALTPLALAGVTALVARLLPDGALTLSLLAVLQVAALGALVLIPVAAIEQAERAAAQLDRQERQHTEATAERDLLVDHIADQLLTPPPSIEGWEVAVHQEPASGELAGDSQQVLLRPDGRFLLAVVDVVGHGSLAALLAFRLRAELAALWQRGAAPDVVAERLNETIVEQRSLASALLIEVDRPSGAVRLVNAGHPPALLLHGASVTEWPSTGPILGVASSRPRRMAYRSMARRDLLVVYTDGVTEAQDAHGELLGERALIRLVRRLAAEDAQAVATACVDLAKEHARRRLRDDALVVAARRV